LKSSQLLFVFRWGTDDAKIIKDRIFDFDDWNSYTIATYRPFLTRDDFDSPISVIFTPENEVTLAHLSGRLMNDLTIYERPYPYVVKSDLTVMPGKTLTIGPGVVLEFYPSVGILVLGTLYAEGAPTNPIVMKPITLEKKRFLDYGGLSRNRFDTRQKSVRLCAEDKCEEGTNQGFLEYYNRTTLRWIPMCDYQFTERNVQTVCRELGFDARNVFFDFGKRWEYMYNHNPVTRVRKWPEPFQCVGKLAFLEISNSEL